MDRQPYTYDSAAPKLEPEEKPRDRRTARRSPEKQPRRALEPKRSLGDVSRRMAALTVCTACIAMLLGFCVRSERRMWQAELARSEMRWELDEQKEVNDALQVELNRKQDLEHIRDLAINRHGLVQPELGQIIYYDRAEQGYVRQYEETPEEAKSDR